MFITASLATIPGREESLKKTVQSLLPQVNKLNVYLHGYTYLPAFLKRSKKIEVAFDIEWGDKGDLDKFHWIKEIKSGWHFICDDDLTYPKDYVKSSIKRAEEFKGRNLFSYHGSIPHKLPIGNYYLDRDVFACLDELPEDQQVMFPGTGVMFYNTKKVKFNLDTNDLLMNMADIHVGIWATQKKIRIITLKHPKGWLIHNDIDHSKSIYSLNVHNPYEQTRLINQNQHNLLYVEHTLSQPLVSIVVVNSRLRNNPGYVKNCLDSIREQSYHNIEVIFIDNERRLMTIGKAFNKGVEQAKGKWILFVGDDDFISRDYVASLVGAGERTENPWITSYLTMFRQVGEGEPTYDQRSLVPTGMWKREFLLQFPFREYLTKFVDTEHMDRVELNGYKSVILRHHYGYFYRSHDHQISGAKALSNENGIARESNIKEIIRGLK